VPCSGARRQNKVLDEVSAAILGGVAAENTILSGGAFSVHFKIIVRKIFHDPVIADTSSF
jgi:hypothetical protein